MEEKIRERIKQLESANQDLEAFCYFVSHDLKAPLSAIDSYSQILKRKYESALDGEGKRIVERTTKNSKMMNKLIDDLLTFSKMTREELIHQTIDMKSLAQSCVEELLLNDNANKYKVQIHSLPECKGDYCMIKQVWTNLLSNAFKYSSKSKNLK
jgi:light-regulated signal transduction histidine kinase (bacteriophytochrome)